MVSDFSVEVAVFVSEFAILGDQVCRIPVKNYSKGSWKG